MEESKGMRIQAVLAQIRIRRVSILFVAALWLGVSTNTWAAAGFATKVQKEKRASRAPAPASREARAGQGASGKAIDIPPPKESREPEPAGQTPPENNLPSSIRAEEEAAASKETSTPQAEPKEPSQPPERFPIWAVAGLSALGGALLGAGLGLISAPRILKERGRLEDTPKREVQPGENKDLGEVWSELKWLEDAIRSLDAAHRSVGHDIERMLDRHLQQVEAVIDDRISTSETSATALVGSVQSELGELRGRLLELQDRLESVQTDGASRLAHGLALLTGHGLGRVDAKKQQLGPVLAVQLERALQDFVKQSIPSDEEISRRLEKVARLNEAVAGFQVAAESMGASFDGRLQQVVEECRSLVSDLETIGASLKKRTLTVRFVLDVPLEGDLSAALADGTASSFQREIQRVNDVGRYFELRWKMVSARAAAECADFADSRLDPRRQRPDLQDALQRIFAAAEITEIAPSRNDDFRAVEHTLVRVTRRSKPDDRSQAVAELLARGFRQGSRIIRKASVILFD